MHVLSQIWEPLTIPKTTSCLYPAKKAEVVLNGIKAKGNAQPDKIPAGSGGDVAHSTAFLALSEVWFT